MTDYLVENEIRGSLSPNEKLVWAGKPKSGIIFKTSDIFLIPFSLLWCGFVIFWESTVMRMNAPFFFMLWGIPFVLVGLYITVGRFFVDARRRTNTIYAITTDRIIIKSGIFRPEIKSLNIRTLSDISFTEKNDHSGTITLGPSIYSYSMFRGFDWSAGGRQAPRFEFIENVKELYDKIIELQRQKL
jgi:hypothetical protein